MRLATIATFSISGRSLYRLAHLRKSLQGVLSHRSERVRTALMMVALFVSYVASAKLGIEVPAAHGVITPVWAPTGIALAALVLYGPRLWPAVALGASGRQRDERRLRGRSTLHLGRQHARGGRGQRPAAACRLPACARPRQGRLLVHPARGVGSTVIAATNGVTTLWISGEVSGTTAPTGSSGGSETQWAPSSSPR